MSFTKLDSGIVLSTVWQEPDHVRLVWITLLALSNAQGYVGGTVPGLANVARVPVGMTRDALDRLGSPDPDSRTPDHGGRRVAPTDGGWRILNYGKYRERSRDPDVRREQNREAQRRSRASKRQPPSATVSHESAEAEAEGRSRCQSKDLNTSGDQAAEEAARTREAPPAAASSGPAYLVRCVVALNAGLKENPNMPRGFREVCASEQSGRVAWQADGIPIEVAERVVRDVAGQYSPTPRSRQPASLRYFDNAVRDAWERQQNPAATSNGRARGRPDPLDPYRQAYEEAVAEREAREAAGPESTTQEIPECLRP